MPVTKPLVKRGKVSHRAHNNQQLLKFVSNVIDFIHRQYHPVIEALCQPDEQHQVEWVIADRIINKVQP
ncbi:Uncharacterised protein [Enterobacter hormaechei]|uniref:hypothetical protein n=1 Tax=Leclercia adecarboxylata TaxID=83655 RepID=UPI00125A0A11|nr:hypothetical protein [Leclercia adecarboxylata]VAE21512.1 Uncharacterised protein [Enterobacter hormaechei]VAE27094.1 Uncharacterised protein [Enterobacter hormaechei]